MSNMILIIGESGTGKSTSIESLDPKETFIIQVVNKPLPFRGFKKSYPLQSKEKKGNRFVSNKWENILEILKHLNKDISYKNIVIDDFQYILSDEYMKRAMERGFDKFTEMAQHYYDIIKYAQSLREDLNIIFLSHSERKDDGSTKVKTIGKLLDEKVTIEGLFTVVLNTKIEDGNYYFETQNNGFNTSKSPKGMFEEYKIHNDLKLVVDKVNEYYGG
ncbi:AAA family ATPase [Peptoniphilus obesi]|uniref:AAA family ATPase n=1 Tax=Peptoniphilus obesi TaxID=1472765 RepID=UPI0004B526FA|nr:AAA family ATPase [Peptoniphilus obesi]